MNIHFLISRLIKTGYSSCFPQVFPQVPSCLIWKSDFRFKCDCYLVSRYKKPLMCFAWLLRAPNRLAAILKFEKAPLPEGIQPQRSCCYFSPSFAPSSEWGTLTSTGEFQSLSLSSTVIDIYDIQMGVNRISCQCGKLGYHKNIN